MIDKVLTLLGFASKAGKLSFGSAKATENIKTKKAKLIIISNDISQKSKKEIVFWAEKSGVPFLILSDTATNTLSNAVGRNCGILSVNDNSFASAITEEYGRKC